MRQLVSLVKQFSVGCCHVCVCVLFCDAEVSPVRRLLAAGCQPRFRRRWAPLGWMRVCASLTATSSKTLQPIECERQCRAGGKRRKTKVARSGAAEESAARMGR